MPVSSGLILPFGLGKTYSCSQLAGTPPGVVNTDFFMLNGNGNKVIRLLGYYINGSATAAAALRFNIERRSTLDTGGTVSQTGNGIGYDPLAPASVATYTYYSAAPALGTGVGLLDAGVALLGAGSIANAGSVRHYGQNGEDFPTIRSATDALCLFLRDAPAGAALQTYFFWNENDD